MIRASNIYRESPYECVCMNRTNYGPSMRIRALLMKMWTSRYTHILNEKGGERARESEEKERKKERETHI